MSDDLFSYKLQAYLHDPINKPFILMQGVSHEKEAVRLAEILAVSLERMDGPDHIASAMERAFLPKGASKTPSLQVKFLEDPVIKHPLSGRELESTPSLKGLDAKLFVEAATKVMEELSEQADVGAKLQFFTLWRNLKPTLAKLDAGGTGKLWLLAPADTRMPDHSIFEHSKIASACSRSGYAEDMLLNKCSLFLFTIGGPQRFIAQARKAQDLFWGSFLLSFLNWKVMEWISDLYGPDSIIFPDIHGQPFADHWLESLGIKVEGSTLKGGPGSELWSPTIPNRTLAIIPEKEGEKLRELGEKLESRVIEAFEAMSDKVLEGFEIEEPAGLREQLSKSFETYWGFVPWFNDEEGRSAWKAAMDAVRGRFDPVAMKELEETLDFVSINGEFKPNIGNVYSLLYSFCEKTVGTLKNMNYFKKFEERGRKCSLCGERNVLFYKKTQRENDLGDDKLRQSKLFNGTAVIFDVSDSRVTPRYLQPGEGLCAVCFNKRCADRFFKQYFGKSDAIDFPSISEVALKKALNALRGEDTYNQYEKLFQTDFDAQLLYEENLNEKFFEKNGLDVNDLDQAKELLSKIKETLIEPKGIKLNKYYAVLKIDGDDMGKWLSGEFAPPYEDIYHPRVWSALDENFRNKLAGKKRTLTPAVHATVSAALKDFSQILVKEIVTGNYDGYLIYAGGDDALALINLTDFLDVMLKLRAAFSGHIDSSLKKVDFTREVSGFVEGEDRILTTMGPEASASMGVCISHYKTPLGMVLEAVREAEEKAKAQPGKDAFCMTILKGSGERLETTWKWFYKHGALAGEPGGTVEVLKGFADVLKGENSALGAGFSDRFIYKFKETFRRFSPAERIPHLDEMVESETGRLLNRSFIAKKDHQGLRQEMVHEWTEKLQALYLESRNLDNYLSLLETAAFIAREP